MKKEEIIRTIDHTLLKQDATWEQIRNLCIEGMESGTASACIPPSFVKQAAEFVEDKLPICTVIGFPNGYQTTAIKAMEAGFIGFSTGLEFIPGIVSRPEEVERLEKCGTPETPELNAYLETMGTVPVKGSARMGDLVRRPQLSYEGLAPFDPKRPELPGDIREAVEIQVKYAGYIKRQLKQVEAFKKEESRLLPPDLDYSQISGLRLEARQKLNDIRPLNIGQASRISGVSPADMAVLMVYLELREKEKQE